MKTILDFVTLHTPDLRATRRYYTEVLGFEVSEERPGGNAFVQASGAGLAIRKDPDAARGHSNVTVSFIVPDAEAYHAQLVQRGAQVLVPPHDGPFGRMLIIVTPDGHRLSFREGQA
ncbi:putative enzyme related to lactoylglutathione lyase [Deinobacterium chartae]|uniref:Putative enzyme related to lactoylglutathione lyase n=1 Tax=Deinobacterium chartae TaxID=521158 RepID=A0A841I513_9DEIO|nr:VOC family protein [Deinobacterium chartae]MBB6100124.1 putative enzyme related to lactoylglutathione lyase [Deinobacterium chartae]